MIKEKQRVINNNKSLFSQRLIVIFYNFCYSGLMTLSSIYTTVFRWWFLVCYYFNAAITDISTNNSSAANFASTQALAGSFPFSTHESHISFISLNNLISFR